MGDSVVALCGGVGGAKLAYGLSRILPPDELCIVVNTGDDFEHFGLHISPDLDTVTYTLADIADDAQGWGRADERWTAMQEIKHLGGDDWFNLGDRDIALHLVRTQMLRTGVSLTETTARLAAKFGIQHTILPMTDDRVRTLIDTDEGELEFQTYFVKRRCEPKVRAIRFEGAAQAKISAQVLRALNDENLRGVILCPSNPYLSVAPILAVADFRKRLQALSTPVIAVSPIIGGRALKGPAAKMMAELGAVQGTLDIAHMYADFMDALLVDRQDRLLDPARSKSDPPFICDDIVMGSRDARIELARRTLAHLDNLRS